MFVSILLAAAVVAIPVFNTEKFCRSSGIGSQALSYDACANTERDARNKLFKEWSSYPRKGRDECASVMRVAPEATYVELLVCIEVEGGVSLQP